MKHTEETKFKIRTARAKQIITEKHKKKISESMREEKNHFYGKTHTKETKRKISDGLIKWYEHNEHSGKGKKHSEGHKQKISETLRGRKLSKERKRKISEALMGRKRKPFSDVWKRNISHAGKGKKYKAETIEKMSKAHKGDKSYLWRGGISFLPYCDKFNFELKEKIRNRDNRVCQLCGKSEILNGRRLSVHHIDGDKMQGCDGKKWYLVALCISCNSKVEFDMNMYEFLIMSNIKWRI